MAIVVALVMFAQAEPGPIDAFRANYAAIKVDMDFVYRKGRTSGDYATDRFWTRKALDFAESREAELNGHWACDGSVEYYDFSSPPDVIAAGKNLPRIPGTKVMYTPHIEGVFDGHSKASHSVEPAGELPVFPDRGTAVTIWNTGDPGYLRSGASPFFWWGSHPFPRILEANFPGMTPIRKQAERAGFPLEVEIYRFERFGSIHTEEFSYDPSIGSLLRYARMAAITEDGRCWFKEFILVEARPCRSGGFVPVEYYDTFFDVPNFRRAYPDYNDETIVHARRAEIGHFKATNLVDRKGPVALRYLEEVDRIHSEGEVYPLPSGTRSLTLAQAKKFAEPRRNASRTASGQGLATLPNLDREELKQFEQPQRRDWSFLSYGAIGCVLVIGTYLVRRRMRVVLLLLVGVCLAGCAKPSAREIKLTGTFNTPFVRYDLHSSVPLTLTVRNDGAGYLRLLGADAGCACRKVDQSRFPYDLAPKTTLKLAVDVRPERTNAPDRVFIHFQTDQGALSVPVALYAFAKNQLSPDSLSSVALIEDEKWAFEFTHRAIFASNEPKPLTGVFVPPGLKIVDSRLACGKVGGPTGFEYQETTYYGEVTDREYGARKAVIALLGAEDQHLAELPVTWQRVRYLSSVPDRVTLGKNPTRVFLRCPDETVELTKVVSAPAGVKAVVSSTREVTVMASEQAPETINGFIEVATTATDRPPLRIPLVRFAPRRKPG